MSSGISNDPGSIQTGLVQVIKDFSDYLFFQKQNGNMFLGISERSYALINKWGMKDHAQPPFFFEGPENASVFVIDSDNSFFKGDSGDLLAKILAAMNLSSDAVFICNMGELNAVHQKIITVSPKVIITLGTKAGQSLLNIDLPLEQLRGKFHEYHGIKVMPTFHPSLLLKQPGLKRQVWEDMKKVMEYAGFNHGA